MGSSEEEFVCDDLADDEGDSRSWASSLESGVAGRRALHEEKEVTVRPVKADHSRSIVHIDFDCFYAQVEVIRRPELRGRPVAVRQKSLLVTTNYIARHRGVAKMSSIRDAMKACPDLVIVNGEDLTPYREMSERVFSTLCEYSNLVERLGLDECFVDVSHAVDSSKSVEGKNDFEGHLIGAAGIDRQCDCGCVPRIAHASKIAQTMRKNLLDGLGLTSSAGIAHNKLVAKIAGSQHKPNQQTVVIPSHVRELMDSQPVRRIPWMGRAALRKLSQYNMATVHDVLQCPRDQLTAVCGDQLEVCRVVRLCEGDHQQPVAEASSAIARSMSAEDSFHNLTTWPCLRKEASQLLRRALDRVLDDGRVPGTMRVSTRLRVEYERHSRQMPVSSLFVTRDKSMLFQALEKVLFTLLERLFAKETSFDIVVLNVAFANFKTKQRASASRLDSFLNSRYSSDAVDLNPSSAIVGTVAEEPPAKKPRPPAHVDKNVWSALPDEVQEELSSAKPAELQAALGHEQSSLTQSGESGLETADDFVGDEKTRLPVLSVSKPTCASSLVEGDPRAKLLWPQNLTTVAGDAGGQATTSSNVFNRGKVVKEASSTTSWSPGSPGKRTVRDTPDDVDPEVFNSLPAELQNELRCSWACSQRSASVQAKPAVGKMKTLKSYFLKK